MRRSSVACAMFGQAVAEGARISTSDLECLDLIHIGRRVTAGRLAELTGLTTGAVTGVVDRLENAGYVRRERDKVDRRKVLISVVPSAAAELEKFYEPLRHAMYRLWNHYSEAELQLLLRFIEDGATAAAEGADTLRRMSRTATARPSKRKASRHRQRY